MRGARRMIRIIAAWGDTSPIKTTSFSIAHQSANAYLYRSQTKNIQNLQSVIESEQKELYIKAAVVLPFVADTCCMGDNL